VVAGLHPKLLRMGSTVDTLIFQSNILICIFRNGFSSVYDVKNYIFPTSFSAICKYEPSDFPELVPPFVPHSHPSYHMLGHQ